jgi:D-alanyl-D-alanine carboxypeptidase/D-alanyl-D-alanine-endopeptidase (penicillin-binding protein 4)
VADDTLFDRVYICPSWPKNQLDHWYCAEVCALSFNDNCLDVSITPANRVGASAAVTCLPETAYVTLTKNCMTVADRRQHAIILARKPGTNEIRIGGSCWIGSPPLKENITIHNPALFFATIFKECLERAGVKVTGEARLTDEPLKEIEVPANEVAASESPLDYVVQFTNKRSQNLCAEQLFKTLGAVKTGAGTFEGGAAAVRDFLSRLQVGQDPCVVADGSGLSKMNRLTPAVMTALLRHMYEHKYREAFVNSLAVPGEEGSLKKRFLDEPYCSRVRAKTGYVAGASCLSGYATTRGGRALAFAIFMNKYAVSNLTMHALQDKIVKALVDM